MARLVLYLRRSSPGEEDKNYSIEEQRRDCLNWNEHEPLRHELIETYIDAGGKSYTFNRLAFQRMMADAKAGRFDLVVVGRWDRFSRDQDQLAVAIYQLDRYGVKVVSATQPIPDGVIGTFLRQTYGLAAQLELLHIRERTTSGRKARIRAGKILVSGHPLYGYQWADPDERSRYVPDPQTAPVVKRIFAAVLAGQTLRQLAISLERDGIPTPGQMAQARGYSTAGKACSSVWRLAALRGILANPAYIGKHSGWRFEARTITVVHPVTGERIERRRLFERSLDDPERIFFPPDVCPALVDEATFRAAQARLQYNKANASRNLHDPHAGLLRGGFARCGYCGRFMQVRLAGSGSPAKGHYRYYRYYCAELTSKGAAGLCPGKAFSVKCAVLDDLIWGWVVHAFENPDLLRKKFAQWRESHSKDAGLKQDHLAAIEGAIKTAKKRKQNYMALVGDLDTKAEETDEADIKALRAEFLHLTQEADRQIKALTREYEQLTAAFTEQEGQIAQVEQLIMLGTNALERLRVAPYEQKRLALYAFGVEVKVWSHDHTPPFEVKWRLDHLDESWLQPPADQTEAVSHCVQYHEYYCRDCNARFEVLTSYQKADADLICQECRGPHVRRLLSMVAKTRKDGNAGYEFRGESDFAGDGDFGGGSCGCGGNCGCH
jgi:site-specific DNA recombinase